MISYDTKEGYMPLLKLFKCVSATLHVVGDLMRPRLGWPPALL